MKSEQELGLECFLVAEQGWKIAGSPAVVNSQEKEAAESQAFVKL
jgi:hypothetical protein